ncbi:hypothetical protein [Paenibacillus radicis (ex Xue et al. 2023)]|uniref:Alpha-L-rhamnosidase n=1 Tax=Paenibacillus radicis (ex Xue et al. 2023) TaxID=2972489 RepID=A0ABT1YDD5_9BACL|nr:hypothetical protein [Paenibacillus radicis (ex Xue et al. 2023)]MCR8631209.1 hypothetical protein [Paenibacillus radicis (ex Xue et al. 2023)]
MENQFKNPSAEYRIHPFWFWNGEMSNDQIKRQIAEMKHKGVGGFFICPRQGLQIPYLSEAWFEKVRTAVECAKQHDMHVWLYDEYPYPSGIAGGEVTLEYPDAKHCTLVHRSERVSGGTKLKLELPWARILSAQAVPVSPDGQRMWDQAVDVRHTIGNIQADQVFQKSGLTAYNQKRYFTYRTIYQMDWEVPAGEWDVILFLEQEIDDFKYYGTFVDPCHREAIECFIRLTHDKYAYYIGDHFGKTIKGMFTDETGLLGKIPWSKQLPDYYKQRTGRGMQEQLGALIYSDSPGAAEFRYDYYQSIHLLLREVYHEQIYDWCERHGLQYVAEVPSVRMTTQLFSHVPGGDSAHEKLGRSLEWILNKYMGQFRNNPKMVSSLARQLNRERNLIECFHSVGWSMTLQDAKWMIDRMAALGTNFYNFHAFFYTLDGLVQHDAPPSQFLQNPYWPHFRQLADYTGRISWLMSEGKADIRIAVLDPTTTLWTHMGNPFHRFDYAGEDPGEKKRLEKLRGDWEELGVQLLRSRIDFDHLDAELLAESDLSGGTIKLGTAEYEVLIIPPVTNLEADAWRSIRTFVDNGGTVIGLGLLPYELIEEGSPTEQEAAELFGAELSLQAQYWKSIAAAVPAEVAAPADRIHAAGSWSKGSCSAYFIPSGGGTFTNTVETLLVLLDQAAPAAVKLHTEGRHKPFLMQTRELSEHSGAVFISNQEGGREVAELQINQERMRGTHMKPGSASYEFRLLDLETGNSEPIDAALQDDAWKISLTFQPYQSHLLIWSQTEEPQVKAGSSQQSKSNAVLLSKQGPWAVNALSENAIRLEKFQLTIGVPNNEMAGSSFEVTAKTFIEQCHDLAQQREFPVAFRQIFGTPPKLSIAYPVACSYRISIQVEQIPQACRLFMDESAIAGDWRLQINGQRLTRADFNHHEVYDHQNIACDVLPYLQQGLNEIVVEVQVLKDGDGVVDALYLQGPFGVFFAEQGTAILTTEPSGMADLPELFCAGYPYYAGTLVYRRTVKLDALMTKGQFELSFKDWDTHDTVEVLVNGQSLAVRPWSPYLWQGSTAIIGDKESFEVEIRVTGTLTGLLEGKYFDYNTHKVLPVEGLL